MATICVQEYSHQIPYGKLIIDKENKLETILEKPVEKHLINAGIYVLDPQILSEVAKNEHYDMTDLFADLISKNLDISVFPIHEYWIDIGKVDDYKKVNMTLISCLIRIKVCAEFYVLTIHI